MKESGLFKTRILQVVEKVLLLLVLLAGLALVGRGGTYLTILSRAESWPTTEGEVVATEIHISSFDNRLVSKHTSSLKVQYTYTVGGVTYSREDRGKMGQKLDKVQQENNQYQVGETVLVHYNPRKPEVAVLALFVAGTERFYYLGLTLVGIVLIMLFVLYLLMQRKRRLNTLHK